MTNLPTMQDWLKGARKKKGIHSVRELGRLTNIPHTTLSDIEKGKKPSNEVCKNLAGFFGQRQKTVFRMAGVIDDLPIEDTSLLIDAIVHETGDLSLDEQEDFLEFTLEFIRFMKQLLHKNDRAPDRRRTPRPKHG